MPLKAHSFDGEPGSTAPRLVRPGLARVSWPAWGAGALAGAAAAVCLWGLDAALLGRLFMAGVSSARAQDEVLRIAEPAVRDLEMRLLALHASLGAFVGSLAGLRVARGRTASRRKAAAASAGVVLLAFAMLLAGMITRYPQLYADRFWLGGGALAAVQYALTRYTHPWLWDAGLLLGGAFLLLTGAPAARAWPRSRTALAAVLAVGAATAWLRPPRLSPSGDPRPDILLLVADSMRRDRLESPEVMPHAAGLRGQGTYFPVAVTPIARTVPSWVSLLTGREPREHGIRTMFPRDEALAGIGPTLFEELRDRGYFTFVVSDFAGDFFPRLPRGFEVVDAPRLDVDTLASSTVLSAHTWSLPLLRSAWVRRLLPEWRNMASLSDPEWLTERARAAIRRAERRPYAGVVFFSNSHFPFAAPHPHYRKGADGYSGRFLYHVPPVNENDDRLSADDVRQVRARYDGALASVDEAMAGLHRWLADEKRLERTVIVVTADHGEELYEQNGINGHGDTIGLASQTVPLALLGPGVPRGRSSSSQVRLIDLPATLLALVTSAGQAPLVFGSGVSLLADDVRRPACVETGVWFWPDRPIPLRGHRLTYDPVTELLEVDPLSRHLVLKKSQTAQVETAKFRGLVLGDRLWQQRLTPEGIERSEETLGGVAPAHGAEDLAALFYERCVKGDPTLSSLHGAVVATGE